MKRRSRLLFLITVILFVFWQCFHRAFPDSIEWDGEYIAAVVYDSTGYLWAGTAWLLCASLIIVKDKFELWALRGCYSLAGTCFLWMFTSWIYYPKGTLFFMLFVGYFLISSIAALALEGYRRFVQNHRKRLGFKIRRKGWR